MNSGHTQTESYRMGLHGPYVLQFTTGAAPSADVGKFHKLLSQLMLCMSTPKPVDLAFWNGLSVTGWVPTASRGYAKGKAGGAPSAFASLVVVGWSNSAAQYWCVMGNHTMLSKDAHHLSRARAEANGNYYSPAMKPGTYTMTSKFSWPSSSFQDQTYHLFSVQDRACCRD